METTEWNKRDHQYFFVNKNNFVLGLSSTEKLQENLKELVDLNSDLCLKQEKKKSKSFKQFKVQNSRKYLDYSNMSTDYYVEQLVLMSKAYVEEMGLDSTKDWDVSARVSRIRKMMEAFDNGKGYQLNIDNFIKILLILQKARNRLPVVIMGETGCGKTYLIQFLVQVILHGVSALILKTMHFGVSRREFTDTVTKAIKRAQRNRKQSVWLFLDEFNTSKLQSHINQMMNDRMFLLDKRNTRISRDTNGVQLPDNLVLVSVCNPYQVRAENKDRMHHVIDAHPEKKTILSHQVLPIPTRMLYGLWNFGALDSRIEQKYIKSIFSDLNMTQRKMATFAETVNQCQDFIRDRVEKNKSSVSLRDIQRVKEMTQFYTYLLAFCEAFQNPKPGSKELKFDDFCIKFSKQRFDFNLEDKAKAFCVALHLNYVYRIFNDGKESKTHYK